jgi:tripartite-type tricarboxylate transporter receptor subunit TctC
VAGRSTQAGIEADTRFRENVMTTKLAAVLLASSLGFASAGSVAAEDAYPTHPILLTHGNTPGSNSDIMARIIADPLAARLGQPVIVESRPGAGQTIAFGRVASGTPDGYTLIMMHSGHPIAGAMYKALKYDTVTDFQMLSTLILYPFVLAVRQDHPLKSMADLIAYAKANPGKLSFSSTGVGTTQHLTGMLLQSKAGIEMNHISYRGATQAVQDVLGGRVDVLIETLTQTSPLITSGQMRGLAVTTAKAWSTQPDIPPVGDTVPGFEVNGWMGAATTHDTPKPIVDRLTRALAEVLTQPEVRARFEQQGNEVQGSTPQEMRDRVAKELAMWKQVVKDGNIPQQ